MALSKSVQQSLGEASQSLRNALAFAARCERSIVAKQIAELIHNIDIMQMNDNLLDKLEEIQEEMNGKH